MQDLYKLKSEPKARPESMIQGEKYRITVLTPQLLRLEYNVHGRFEDRATQTVLNRDFPTPEFKCFETEQSLEIVTENVRLLYDKKPFSRYGLSLEVRGGHSVYMSKWCYGEDFADLKGTARTLDEADGAVPLGRGLMSRNGFSVIDDSRSLLLREDGWVEPRAEETCDIYFLGYGRDYKQCLRDFYHLCGRTPLLPRYALGNWWSRYHRYDEAEYRRLMDKFTDRGIPFSVAVIDMDWHVTEVDPKYGSGWTGYTWNKELFPDPGRFLHWLHDKGLRVTLNVHPADGVRPHEEQYKDMARALGRDYAHEESLSFDFTDPAFVAAYFKYLHHPHEALGVDFWWIDWQQGSVSKIPGLDPLWMLNHYHYLDSGRRGARRLTFSRYAGVGSHRYPIGFSGDTVISWESLDFQPYFTANASNVGYGWWSHDIGGHCKGSKDDELSCRWLQFGVFSPICRLHSTKNPFNGKEPWNFNKIVEEIMVKFLRLRHQLIPYLYTMNRKASREGLPLIRPLYYEEPLNEFCYHQLNQYYFGDDFLLCPITRKIDEKAQAAPFTAWLPAGRWVDFFSGRMYEGGVLRKLYRGLESIPALLRLGSIIPLADLAPEDNSVANPAALLVKIFAGADGRFDLWEDDGLAPEDRDENWCKTSMQLRWSGEPEFIVRAAEGNRDQIPARRSYQFVFVNVPEQTARLTVNGETVTVRQTYSAERRELCLALEAVSPAAEIRIRLETDRLLAEDKLQACFAFLHQAQIEYWTKLEICDFIEQEKDPLQIINFLESLELDAPVYGALAEIISAWSE